MFIGQPINGFRVVNHITCFTLFHMASEREVDGPAFKTVEAAEQVARESLSWFYSVSYKNRNKLVWIDTFVQNVMEASRLADGLAAARGISGKQYGISRTNAPVIKRN
jgi:hypothetical protein